MDTVTKFFVWVVAMVLTIGGLYYAYSKFPKEPTASDVWWLGIIATLFLTAFGYVGYRYGTFPPFVAVAFALAVPIIVAAAYVYYLYLRATREQELEPPPPPAPPPPPPEPPPDPRERIKALLEKNKR